MKKKIFALAFLALMLCLSSATPVEQEDIHAVPGKLIIQLDQSASSKIGDLEATFSFAGFKPERCLSKDLGIWLCSYDMEAGKGNDLLKQLLSDQRIMKAQFDHYISQRDILANDPSFAMQWALYNIGQTGGVVDADIDATKAWEVSVNNGITILGDTIIIAVIDDGFDLDHEDMNFWKNYHEIPANGIDDDNNGYVDDYDGWNAFTSTGEITVRSHGTKVAGIAGAIGNNGIGISGVGWNCKVMPVAGSSTFESTVVEAFAYVYKMRSLYEESNGQKGAYVVVTNGSFGVDFGNPENYPIWGMMYDSLGSLGILNAAATMNHESNADIVGDVPTNFSSDYIIGVTNTTKDDVKYNTAAWGMVSIDLGAPGSNIISTKTNNTYGYTTGTSMAAPQLSGAIALIYSAAGEDFLQHYDENPEEAALFVKNIILEGVDTLPGFDTLCVSGGRLNVDSAVRLLMNPRIIADKDTVSISLGPDSTGMQDITLQNLLSFELPFHCSIENTPAWIGFSPVHGSLPGYGYADIAYTFDAGGLSLGNYYCEALVTDAGGMQLAVTIELKVIPNMGIGDQLQHDILASCYPNPFTNRLMIEFELTDPGRLQFSAFALSGELIHAWQEHAARGKQIVSWDATGIPPGVYIVRVSGNGFDEQMKVVKMPY